MRDSTSVFRILILGAAGRDFHCFNVVYRDDPGAEVVGFTATQIPGIEGRLYPPALCGERYPQGIAIRDEAELEAICREQGVDEVVFAYSDVSHTHVMHLASRALAAGADFRLLGPERTMLRASVPVIAVSAVRTGCGKSQTARWITRTLIEKGLRVAAIRHPMPYGDLEAQAVQRFATRDDLERHECTTEEREEYELYIEMGSVIFAGVDYAAILREAEKGADVLVWDGGNNDFPFFHSDLHVVLVDALRADQVTTHHPGEAVARMADVAIVNKIDAAPADAVERAIRSLRRVNPRARILRAASPVQLDDPDAVAGRRVLVVEDGPTTTHGGMAYGAGYVAAIAAGAGEIVDPRAAAVPEIAAVFERFPHLGNVLPAMGYGARQIDALRRTIDASDADVVVSGSPIDLEALLDVAKPVVRARYHYEDADSPGLAGVLDEFLAGWSG
ncbi:MAG: GTPase [bacterium]|nr:GTPase [bacterium]